MKKFFVFMFLLLISSGAGFCQSDVQQAVSPKTFYVGDIAEIRYSFKSGVDFFSDKEKDVFERELTSSRMPFAPENENFTLVSAILIRSKTDYTFVMTIIPWKSGTLIIPSIDLYSVVYEEKNVPFVITLQPVEVSSLLSDKEEMALRPPAGPLLVPGTIYFVWGIIILTIVLIVLAVRVILKWSVISAKIRIYKIRMGYIKNSREAVKNLSKLLKKKNLSDTDFCSQIQIIMRRYLSFKFGSNFSVVPSSQIMFEFMKITSGVMSEFIMEQVENLSGIFRRTDYIRFASGSIDSMRTPREEYETVLQSGERAKLVNSASEIISHIEGGL